jgi:type IV fimbrial biogenesis protein FimT
MSALSTTLRRARAAAGFTLIELMMVLVVVGVLLAVAQPWYTRLIATTRARSAATDLYTALNKARGEAVKRNSTVRIAPISSAWENGWQIIDANNAVIDDHGALSGISVTGGPASLTYQSSGRISGGVAPAFLLTSTAESTIARCVSADLSGRPYLKTC